MPVSAFTLLVSPNLDNFGSLDKVQYTENEAQVSLLIEIILENTK